MSGAPLAVPASPASSSKRSRSRDSSAASRASSTLAYTPAGNTPAQTPMASAPSLVIPATGPGSSAGGPDGQDPTPYPAFLRLSKADVHVKMADLEWDHRQKLQQGSQKHILQQQRQRQSEEEGESQQGQEPEQPEISPYTRCSGEEVASRNRYVNVDPYELNRVRLKVPEGCSDYINASPILLKSTRSGRVTRFIATQGPKQDLVSHFWRMIWQETRSPATIVMLTRTHEAGREKCYPYYPLASSHSQSASPESSSSSTSQSQSQSQSQSPSTEISLYNNDFGDDLALAVRLVEFTEHEEARAEVRELALIKHHFDEEKSCWTYEGGETKKVWHLLFEGWPDFSVPEGRDRKALVELVRMSRVVNGEDDENGQEDEASQGNPRVVHCSAGVGRSGTFIALDWLLRELEEGALDKVDEGYDPVVEVVQELRRQRMMMVQGEAQLGFLYEVLREEWRERWIRMNPEEADRLGLKGREEGEEPERKKVRQEEEEVGEEQPGDEDEAAERKAEEVEEEAEREERERQDEATDGAS
ncbi:phosphatases II [Westerdykella ornata]|uniref:Phosphatases II n=1 Tax=Westerdykella ornata TaxID=318751 RepID=A0A6A6JRU3_WESOR|nr:phosphatases II [Westerdykella ornata]KAF2278446.1 phosphatases II [Westerdykella ornata]